MDKLKNVLKKIADLTNEHWIWKTIILFLPSIYLPLIVKYWGNSLFLLNGKERLSVFGIILTVIIYVSVLVINVLSNYKAKRDKERDLERERQHKQEIKCYQNEIQEYLNTLDVYDRLMNVIGNICDVKLSAICNYLNAALENGEFHKPFNETVYPEKQLKSIAKEMKACLSEITNPPVNNISVSMAYEFPCIKSEIKWIDNEEIFQCMQLSSLKTNKNTAFYQIYTEKTNFLFYNDKHKAEIDGKYVFDQKDDRNRNIGSIICDEISIEDENGKVARIILTISTYGYKFTDVEDGGVLDNMSDMIQEVILQQFEKRIRIELALLFIKKQYNKK